MTPHNAAVIAEIRRLYGVVPLDQFDAKRAIEERVTFLVNFLRTTDEGYRATFVAMRLPAGIQRDEADAQTARNFIDPDVLLTVNIGEASTAINDQGVAAYRAIGFRPTATQIDFNKGSVQSN